MSKLCAVAFVVFLSAVLQAQSTVHGSLAGTISDPQGLVIANAQVTVTSAGTNFQQTRVTDLNGSYFFARVAPGAYRVVVASDGFRNASYDKVEISVAEAAVLNISLEVGQSAEAVTIMAAAELVQSQSADVSLLMPEKRIKDLPLNGRNFSRLMLLAPGAAGVTANNNSAVSGGRPTNNSYAVDGIGSNDERTQYGFAFGSGSAGTSTDLGATAPNVISTEAIQEFRIVTSNADASFGRGSGAQVNMITKSGSNEVHGSAYEFLRNDKLDARDFFNTGPFLDSLGRAKSPPFKQNLFGATLGGPMIRDRHFFFGNYEGLRQALLQSRTAVIPNAALISQMPGHLGRFYRAFYIDRGLAPATGNPSGEFRPIGPAQRDQIVAAGFPQRLFDGDPSNDEAGTVLISTSPNRDVKQDAFLIRTDHRLTEKLHASARYSLAQPSSVSNFSNLPVDFTEGRRRYQSASVEMVYTAMSSHIIEARIGFLRSRLAQGPAGGFDRRLTSAGVSEQFGLAINPAGTGIMTNVAYGTNGFYDAQTVPQQSVQHTWVRRGLTVRSGAEFRQLAINVNNGAGQPSYTFSGFTGPNGILGTGPGQAQAIAQSVSATVFGSAGGPTSALRAYRTRHYEAFIQTDWRSSSKLTLSAGLRYSYFTPYFESNNAIANLYAIDADGAIEESVSPFYNGRTANRLALPRDRYLYRPDRNNFQPRLGAAWEFREGSVLRASYGAYADRLVHIMFTNVVINGPLALSSNAPNQPFILGSAFPVTALTPSVTALDPTIENPFIHRFNVAIEQRIDPNTTVTAAYVGSRSWNLPYVPSVNGFGGVPQASRPDPRYTTQTLLTNGPNSRYDALQTFLKRRFSNGLDFTAAWTYSHAKDQFTSETGFGPFPALINAGASAATGFQGGGGEFAPRALGSEYGFSGFDVRHALTFSHVWELPFGRGRRWLNDGSRLAMALAGGWSLSGVAVITTGEPVNVRLGRDLNDDGDVAQDRPALLQGSLDDLYARSSQEPTQWFVPQAEAGRLLGDPPDVTDPRVSIARNALRGPGARFYDLSLMRAFTLSERVKLRFEANAFNVFNNVNFGPPVSDLSSDRFGRLISTREGVNPRQLQLGLKVTF